MKLTGLIFNKRLYYLTTILMFFLLFLSSIGVYAHSPSNMSLSYNNTINELKVSITHQVSDPETHYVFQIIVKINGLVNITQDYSSQPSSSFTYTYKNIEAVEGDTFEVTANCNQGGSITKQLTVSSEEVSETGDDSSSTPGFELILLIISFIIIIIFLRKK